MSVKPKSRYARLMGSFWRHPKTMALSLAARGLHCSALAFCADNMTDGAFPAPMVSAFCGGVADGAVVSELVAAGLWKAKGATYEIKDWAQHNITAASWAQHKAATKERVARSRERNKAARNTTGNDDVTRYTGDGNEPSLDEGRRTKDDDEGNTLACVQGRARDTLSIVKRVYAKRYEAKWRDAFMGFDSAHRQLQAIATWAAEQADGPEAAMHRLLDGADRQERLERARWPLRWLAEDPSGHANYQAAKPARKTGYMPAATREDFAAELGEEESA